MLLLGILYFIILIKTSKKEPVKIQKDFSEEFEKSNIKEKSDYKVWSWNIMLLFGGIVATIYGAEKLVDGAVNIAQYFGMSDAVIGLTIVSIGTGAPEIATTIVGTICNKRDIAVGNLLGSSITNIFIKLGTIIILTPEGVNVSKDILWFDLPLAALVTLVCYPVFKSDQMVSRKEGIVFVSLYLLYL